MSSNTVTGMAAITDNGYNISDNNLVCIDLEQGFIGVNNSAPAYQIDVSGVINCTALRVSGELFNAAFNIDFSNFILNIVPQTVMFIV